MSAIRQIAVIDIGKTNAKVALVDLEHREEVAVRTRPNTVVRDGPYPHFDIDGLWRFILDGLTALNQAQAIDAISVTTHGATAALLDASENLALPVLDYEHEGIDETAEAYDAVRAPFSETGSPRLPVGLNLGAQLFWQAKRFPDGFARVNSIVMYPQYWAARLSGVVANEVTSLGCHTDLWSPTRRDYSGLLDARNWRGLMPPVRRASDRLGPLLPALAAKTGIAPGTPVFCGIHDSNASLLPHLMTRSAPFSVVSTGTWVVSMAVGGKQVVLDPARDTLINVNAFGDPIPSARFMGGREFELIMQGTERRWHDADLDAILVEGAMLLPSIQPGSGPFPGMAARWMGVEPQGGRRFAAASAYLALMTATCLDLIGAEGEIIVEGPFATNAPFVAMLEAATTRPVLTDARTGTGTSVGAALLASPGVGVAPKGEVAARPVSDALRRYAALWRGAAVR